MWIDLGNQFHDQPFAPTVFLAGEGLHSAVQLGLGFRRNYASASGEALPCQPHLHLGMSPQVL